MALPKLSLSYPNWTADKSAAETIYAEYPTDRFEQKLAAIKLKEKLFQGDRSHPDIQTLDNTQFTYKGWEEDNDEAERRLTGDCTVLQLGTFKSFFLKMKKKEAINSRRDSIECLRERDSAEFTYPDFEVDKATAEKIFAEYPTTHRFHEKLTAMINKERLYRGDRSHPDIVALDETKFTYPQWEKDKEEAVKRHCGDCTLFQLGVTCRFLYNKMLKKQRMFENRVNVPALQDLDRAYFTYTGWEKDKEFAEQYYAEFSTTDRLHDKVEAMKNKQRLLSGDRSHPDIVALDSTTFDYQGWEKDKEEAERRHIGNCTVLQLGTFHVIFDKMKKMQGLYDSQSNMLLDFVGLDSLLPSKGPSKVDLTASSSSFHPTKPFRNCCMKTANDGDWDDPLKASSKANKCVVCLEHEPLYAFIPCGHLCVCAKCVPEFDCSSNKEYREVNCPICRKSALCVTRIFTA